MTTVPVAERLTAEEFLATPEPELGWPRSLIDGEVVMNDPTALHAYSQKALLLALQRWTEAAPGRGEVALPWDVRLDDRNVFKPDLLWYSEGRAPDPRDPRPYPMPDLAVEVRSPSTWRYDIGVKKARYEHHGLPELWLVDTAATAVLVFRRSSAARAFDVTLELERDERLTSPLLPDLEIAVGELFPRA